MSCCGGSKKASSATISNAAKRAKIDSTTPAATWESVKDYYGKVLSKTEDLKTSACTTAGAPPLQIRQILSKVPAPVVEKYYGCGSPFPASAGLKGMSVLDLGCGSGRDCYIASSLVGEKGKVIGVDMTEEQLQVAREHAEDYCTKQLGYKASNMSFYQGYMEDLASSGVTSNSVDLVISNCVINLSPQKTQVLQGVYNALREGGELYFSDVYCDRRLPQHVKSHQVLWGECISGALYTEDFKRICKEVGFQIPYALETSKIDVTDPELRDVVGEAKFYSITYRCFKLPALEDGAEDYGQIAIYNGTIPGQQHAYRLDENYFFEARKGIPVCGNAAEILSNTWLKHHFQVIGDKSTHFGKFNSQASIPLASQLPSNQIEPADTKRNSSSGGSSCC